MTLCAGESLEALVRDTHKFVVNEVILLIVVHSVEEHVNNTRQFEAEPVRETVVRLLLLKLLKT